MLCLEALPVFSYCTLHRKMAPSLTPSHPLATLHTANDMVPPQTIFCGEYHVYVVCDVFPPLQVWTKGSQSWQLDQIGFVFNATAHIIGTSKDLVNLTHEQQLYKTSLQRAYECSSVEIDDLKSANPNVTLTAKVHIRSFELQAFQFTDHDKFDACK